MTCSYDFLISELLLRVQSSRQLQVPDNFYPFLVTSCMDRNADILLEIHFQTVDADALPGSGRIHWNDGEYIVCQEPAGRGEPCRLFLPPDFAEDFCRQGKWLNYIPMERLLLPWGRVILHASAVIHQGKAYLFSAPSGGGKSTHAALWRDCFGAEILNGDKVILYEKDRRVIASGSPIAGSSGIYCRESAPVEGIFFLKKSSQNRILPLTQRAAFLSLYAEAVKSMQDADFNSKLLDDVVMLTEWMPAYSLECLPERSAVECILNKQKG